jgi:hypothetical protein
VAALNEALGEAVPQNALIDLPETDLLAESYLNGYQSAIKPGACSYRKFFSRKDAGLVFGMLERMAAQLGTEPAFLITKQSEDCGAVRWLVASLLRNAAAIIRLDGDSLSALSLSGTEGVLIDYNADDQTETYEVAIWGERWPIIALACETQG